MFRNKHRIMPMTVALSVRLLVALAIAPLPALAEEAREALRQQLTTLKQQMLQMQHTYQSQLDLLEARLKQLEQQEAEAPSVPLPVARRQTQPTVASSPLQIGLSGLFAAGGSNADNNTLEGLQAGGHDPSRNGFPV